MRRISQFVLLLALLCGSLPALAMQNYQNWCQTGATPARTQGMQSTNTLQASYPKCTVTVYLAGTQNLATLYVDGSSDPLSNPFTATSIGSYQFYAADGCYDVSMSGGLNGGFPAPVTLPNVCFQTASGGSTPGAPSYSVQFNNAVSGFGGDGTFAFTPSTHTLAVQTENARTINGELNCALYSSPQACLDAGGVGSHVYFPSGTYSTPGLGVYSTQTIDCAAGNLIAGSGVVFTLTGANWGLYNPNADTSSGTPIQNETSNVVVRNCTFDISGDSSALGGLRIKGINWSQFYGVKVLTDNNSGPAIVLDGSNFAHNGGNYFNDFYGPTVYDKAAAGTSSGLGVLVEGSRTGIRTVLI